jgi:hypothetical protein
MADHYKAPLIEAALRMAARNHELAPKAIFHTDRGSNGEFKWSSQHLGMRGVDGQASGMDEGVDGQVCDEVAPSRALLGRPGA